MTSDAQLASAHHEITGRLIDGKQLAAQVKATIRQEVEGLLARGGRRPGLAVVMVGNNPASEVYVRNKRDACAQLELRMTGHPSGHFNFTASGETSLPKLRRSAGR